MSFVPPPATSSLRTSARRARRLTGFVAITASLLPLYIARDRLTTPSTRTPVRNRWLKRWAGSLLRLFGVRVRYSPFAETRAGVFTKGRLVVANHRSALDVGILLQHFGGHMVSRADLKGWPIVGPAARSVGTVFVDRASASSGASTIREVRALLRAGETVLLFPEGTTFEGDTVRPFQAGAFLGALRTGASIVPVGIAYATGSQAAFVGETFPQHLTRMAGSEPTSVVVVVGDAIPIEDGAKAAEVAQGAEAAVQRLVLEARQAVDGLPRG